MNKKNYNLAFVFPGQGSQSLGMLAKLADHYPEVQQTFDRASEVLNKDLWRIVSEGPEELLSQTQITQPAMLSAGYAVWRIWCSKSNIRPEWMLGHSLGEYTALVCAEAIDFEDAIRLVAERGRLMQEAVPEGTGAMAAILGLEDHEVVKVCLDAQESEIVSPANYNAPGQVVIAGHTTAVDRAIILAKQAGAKKSIKLAVSVPSHCQLMEGAAHNFAELLSTVNVQSPQMTLIHNSDVCAHGAPEVIRNVLKEQLYKPVRWSDGIRFVRNQGVTNFVECGPGKVLFSLNKRIANDVQHLTVYDPDTLNQALEQL